MYNYQKSFEWGEVDHGHNRYLALYDKKRSANELQYRRRGNGGRNTKTRLTLGSAPVSADLSHVALPGPAACRTYLQGALPRVRNDANPGAGPVLDLSMCHQHCPDVSASSNFTTKCEATWS